LPTLRERVAPLGVDEPVIDEQSRSLSLPVRGGAEVLRDALRLLDDSGVTLVDVGLRRPDLDDVFLILTGHASEAPSSNGSAGGGSSDGAAQARSDRHALKGADQ
jgi:ABC-2 type transport system ATP-binding protein